MDNLIAKASTSVPRSLRSGDGAAPGAKKHTHILNKKLRATLDRQSAQTARAKQLAADAALLASNDAGALEVEGELERTWRVGQDEIVKAVGAEAARGRREMTMDGGPYRVRYTRNGRHMAVVGGRGHVATFDWQTGTMHSELQLGETCRDITFLQNHTLYAVAQKKCVFIYDRDGVEIHRLKAHVEPTRLEFLPFHWLLASAGLTGYLKYQDTSTGQLVAEHRTKLGPCSTLTQNPHTAVLYAGHANGQVTLWTPNMPDPAVRLLAHLGPVHDVAVDASSAGRYMATAGADGRVKIWDCRNWKGAVREWSARGGPAELDWAQRGMLAVASGGTVNVHHRPSIVQPFAPTISPPLYLTHPVPHRPLQGLRFCPFNDVLSVGHADGVSCLIVPGSGEPNFDSMEADPFENRKARREREVKGLLDKIQPDMITLDPEFIGSLAPQPRGTAAPAPDTPFARLPRIARLEVSGKADTTELPDTEMGEAEDADDGDDGEGEGGSKRLTKEERERRKAEHEKKRMRGRNKATKRFLRKQRKNVIDPKAVALREKLAKEREARQLARGKVGAPAKYAPSVLDRFKPRPGTT